MSLCILDRINPEKLGRKLGLSLCSLRCSFPRLFFHAEVGTPSCLAWNLFSVHLTAKRSHHWQWLTVKSGLFRKKRWRNWVTHLYILEKWMSPWLLQGGKNLARQKEDDILGKKARLKMCSSDCINEICVIWGERSGWGLVPLGPSVPDGNVACVRGMSESGAGVSEGEKWLLSASILRIPLVENGEGELLLWS